MAITYQQIAPFGKIVWTKGIFEATEKNQEFRKEVVSFLSRHINHDWGCLTSKDDAASNDRSVKKANGGYIHSGYLASTGQHVWIITNGYNNHELGAEYCYTTVLFPKEN